jgi:N utilization substance protein B
MLYAMDLTDYLPDEVFAGFNAIQDLNRDAFYYARRLVDGVHGHLEEIDAVLTRFAEHWKIHRMAVVDRNLLRLGVYELMFLKEIPFPIVINEALEIVKEFSDQEGTQFVNGILDAASKEFRPDETGIKGRGRKTAPVIDPSDAPLDPSEAPLEPAAEATEEL